MRRALWLGLLSMACAAEGRSVDRALPAPAATKALAELPQFAAFDALGVSVVELEGASLPEVRLGLEQRAWRIAACLRPALERDPDLRGSMFFAVGREHGSVDGIFATLPSARCVLEELRALGEHGDVRITLEVGGRYIPGDPPTRSIALEGRAEERSVDVTRWDKLVAKAGLGRCFWGLGDEPPIGSFVLRGHGPVISVEPMPPRGPVPGETELCLERKVQRMGPGRARDFFSMTYRVHHGPPFGRDDAVGADPLSARGNMWGDTIGEAFGAGGLGLEGIGDGGGGRGEGIGLGSLGTIGHGAGVGAGQGFGRGVGGLAGRRRPMPANVRGGAVNAVGRLPPEVIQRIVRRNFGRLRLCYEEGLRKDPKLAGRINVHFVIAESGKAGGVIAEATTPALRAITPCVLRAFQGLEFPQPEEGSVRVIFPVVFSPAASASSEAAPEPPPPPPPPPAPPEPLVHFAGVVSPPILKGDGAPAVEVRGRSIAVDGTTAATLGDVGRITKVDGLFQALASRRDAWRVEHAAANFPGVCSLAVASDLPAVDLKSVLGTMAHAACPTLRMASFEIHAEHAGFMAGLGELHTGGRFLDVKVASDGYALAWRDGSSGAQVLWEQHASDLRQLSELVSSSWLQHGHHRELFDRERDQCFVHFDDELRWGHLAPVLDAIDEVKRDIQRGAQTLRMPAFLTTLALR
jgi:hypothetical protein